MRKFVSNIRKVIAFVLSIDKSFLPYVISLVVLQAVQPFIPITFMSMILNALEESREIHYVVSLILAMVALSSLVSTGISFLNKSKDIKFNIIQKKISRRMGELALAMDYSILEDNEVRKLFTRARDVRQVVGIFNNFTTIVSIAIIMNMSVYSMFLEDFAKLTELCSQSAFYKKGGRILDKADDYEIEFRNVSFKYPKSETYVLKNLNIKFSSRKSIAIVGENGAGKTTLIKLLLRLYKPEEGQICINGEDIRNIDYQSYLELFSVVFQDFKTYAFSVRENVTAGKTVDEERLAKAYKESGLLNKIEHLPKGDETIIMRGYDEEGIEISGGETQKVAIARAIYKDTPVVIFDEPTASLDPIAEYMLYKDIQRIQKDKLAIFITHRLTSTRFCDEIFVLAGGRVQEHGTHEELMNKRGLYYEMYSKQAFYYQTEKAAN